MKPVNYSTDPRYVLVQERPKKVKTRHIAHWLAMFALAAVAPPLAPFYLLIYILCIFETRRTNKKNGY